MLYKGKQQNIQTMKIKTFALAVLSLALSTLAAAQSRNVTLKLNNATLTTVLKSIEKMGEKNILFVVEETDGYKLSVDIRRSTQREALEVALARRPFRIVERNTYFAIQSTGKSHAAAVQTRGKVVDANRQPMGYANVAMYAAGKYVGGCVTADDGTFVLPFPPDGATVKVSFVGYKTQTLACTPDMTIAMHEDTQQLKGVSVTSKHTQVSYKNGAFVTGVAGTVLGELESAQQVLEHLPFVTTENGGLSVIGRGTPDIYLNGRKISDNTELALLSAKDILNAEIVTMPGARYSAQTKAVIRLRTVRKRGEGLSGNAVADYAQAKGAGRTSENLRLNYRTGGLDIFGEAGGGYGKSISTAESRYTLHTNADWLNSQKMRTVSRSGNLRLLTGFNYETKNRQSFGARYEARRTFVGDDPSHGWGEMTAYRDGTQLERFATETTDKMTPHWSHRLNTYYNATFGKWELDYNGDYYQQTSESRRTTLNDGTMGAESWSREKSRVYAAKVVATTQIGKGALSFGTEETFTDRRDDFTQSGYSEDAANHIKQAAAAGFAEYYHQLGKFSLGAGLRYEYQKTTYYKQGVLRPDQSPSYNDLIPFLSLGYNGKDWAWGLAWRTTKQNPAYSMLQTSVNYINKYMYKTGEPLLKPQKQHELNLSGSWKWVSFSYSHCFVKNMYTTWIRPYDADNHPEVLLSTMAVIPNSYYGSVNVRLAPSFGLWKPALTMGMNYYHEDIDHLDVTAIGYQPKFVFMLDNSFKLPRKWFATLTGTVSTRAKQGHGLFKCMGNVQMGVSKKFLKNDALRVGLTVRDIFHTDYYKLAVGGTKSTYELNNYDNSQAVKLNIRYTFNATKDKYKGQGAGESEINRL